MDSWGPCPSFFLAPSYMLLHLKAIAHAFSLLWGAPGLSWRSIFKPSRPSEAELLLLDRKELLSAQMLCLYTRGVSLRSGERR